MKILIYGSTYLTERAVDGLLNCPIDGVELVGFMGWLVLRRGAIQETDCCQL